MRIGKPSRIVCVLLAIAAVRCFSAEISVDLRPRNGQLAQTTVLNAASNAISDDGVVRQHRLSVGAAEVQGLAVGDLLILSLFEDRELQIELVSEERSLVGRSFLGRMQNGLGLIDCVVLETENGLVVDVTDSKNGRVWKVISDENGVQIKEVKPTQRIKSPTKPLLPPEPDASIPELEVNTKNGETTVVTNRLVMPKPNVLSKVAVVSFAATSLPTVDIMVAYDTEAANWARSNGGGLQSFAETCVQKMNTAIANTGLNSKFTFRLVGTYEVGGSAGGNLTYALYYASGTYSGTLNGVSWSGVAQKRDELGADVVCVLVDTGSAYGTTGLGWALQADTWNPASCGCNACAIRSVAQSHTMTHEVGHNMGAGHSDQMADKDNCGPQYHSYSSGYYFYVNGKGYYTIMSYNADGYGNYYTEVPYFSSPDYKYLGVAVGDATHNNSKTLSLTYSTVVNNRQSTVGPVIPPSPSRPANDDFANATTISGNSGSTTGSNVGATSQSNEPLLGSYPSATTTVWWKWTAPSAGRVQFDTIGTSFDTVMGIYSGTSLALLTEKAKDDDGGGSLTSKCTFDCTGGTTYYICVGGYSAADGTIKLNWSLTQTSPSAPTGVSATDGSSTANVTVKWNSVSGATSYRVYRATSSTGTKTELGSWQTSCNYTDTSATPGTLYYYWVKAKNSGGTSGFSSSDTGYRKLLKPTGVSATDGTSATEVTVTWSAVTGASYYRVYRATSSAGTKTALGSWQTSCTYKDSGATAGTTYYYFVQAAVNSSGLRPSDYSAYDTGYRAVVKRPSNDTFANATVISGQRCTSGGSNKDAAQKESGEPNHAGYATATSSIWWKWTAPYKGKVQIDTIGSSIDTVLAVYTGSSVGALTSVAYDDDNGEGFTSRVDFTAAKGTTYYIAVSGVSGEYGDIVLNLQQFPEGQTTISKANVSANGKMQFSFKAQAGKTYYVQRATSLANGGNWTTVGQAIKPTATTVQSVEAAIDTSKQSGFYRILTAE